MSSNLIFEKIEPKVMAHFKHPFKGIFSKKYWDTDGSCGDGEVIITSADVSWLEGVLDAGSFEKDDKKDIENIIKHLKGGGELKVYHEH